jgi:clan AA aspartic protease
VKVGEVTGAEPFVQIVLREPARVSAELEVVLDTGFTGDMTLPAHLVAQVGLTEAGWTRAELANGQVIGLKLYRGFLDFAGETKEVYVLATGSEPLLGMSALHGFEVCLDVQDGGEIRISPLAQNSQPSEATP